MNPIRAWLIRRATRHWDRCTDCGAHPLNAHGRDCTIGAELFRTAAEAEWGPHQCADHTTARAGACDCGDNPHHADCTVTQGARAQADQRLTDHFETAPKERT